MIVERVSFVGQQQVADDVDGEEQGALPRANMKSHQWPLSGYFSFAISRTSGFWLRYCLKSHDLF